MVLDTSIIPSKTTKFKRKRRLRDTGPYVAPRVMLMAVGTPPPPIFCQPKKIRVEK